jgi:hypothetical protein
MQGQLGGNVPDFFRQFSSSFAWMSGFGSSLGLQNMANSLRDNLGAPSDYNTGGTQPSRRLLSSSLTTPGPGTDPPTLLSHRL